MNAPRSIDDYLKQLRAALEGQDPAREQPLRGECAQGQLLFPHRPMAVSSSARANL